MCTDARLLGTSSLQHQRDNVNLRKSARAAVVAFAALALALTGCSGQTTRQDDGKKLSVYATTGYLADAVANIAPDAEITTMVGPGGDPHTYQPSTQDIEKMRSADLVFWNGLNLEAHMTSQLESFGDRQLAVGSKVPEKLLLPWPEKDDKGRPLHDPHIWNSPEAWLIAVDSVADKIAEADPKNEKTYRANAEKYKEKIRAAVSEADAKLAKIDAPRILVTGHDAFNYFGKHFDLEVHATDFISTEAKRSAKEIDELATLIASKKVPTIFLDNQATPQAIKSLQEAVHAKGWDVKISDAELYADSLGAEPGVDTYLGAFTHNVDAVAEALGK